MINNYITQFVILCCLSFLPFVFVRAQEIPLSDINSKTEDSRCFEKKYQHKTARQLARMTPEQLIDESTKEWNYHVSLLDKYGMFTIADYKNKIGIAIVPVLTKLAQNFGAHPNSRCQQERFFTAFSIAADVDNQITRLRTTKDGKAAILAATTALQQMKNEGLADPNTNPYNKYGFGLDLLRSLQGTNEHDELIRELLVLEFQLRLSDQEFLSFVEYLASVNPKYPSWAPSIYKYGLPGLRKNKQKYQDAYLQFKKTTQKSKETNSNVLSKLFKSQSHIYSKNSKQTENRLKTAPF